jgi:hypothetical protein
MITVEDIRKAGSKVRVMHWRMDSKGKLRPVNQFEGEQPSLKGGKTRIEITTNDGKELAGEAICSTKDSFNRRLGISIALGRALTA